LADTVVSNGVPYGFHPAGTRQAAELIERHDAGQQESPLVILLDGTLLADPSDAEIMDGVRGVECREIVAVRHRHGVPAIGLEAPCAILGS
jgi:hypothetical protein